jgi:hypothetical protein
LIHLKKKIYNLHKAKTGGASAGGQFSSAGDARHYDNEEPRIIDITEQNLAVEDDLLD